MARTALGVVQVSAIDRYRSAVEQLIDELATVSARGSRADAARELDEWLRLPTVRQIIDVVPGGAGQVLRQAVDEYRGFFPSAASNASDPVALVRIVLLQQVDLVWWATSVDLPDAAAVASSPELVDLRSWRAAGGVRFGYGVGSDRLLRRARDFAVQRLQPAREPRGPGLPFQRARPEMIGLLNEIADRVSLLTPPATPSMWVNSIVRSVAHQRRLRDLGFTALLPSAHCRGWAADIELTWFDRFHGGEALREVLLDYQASGVLNVIDEGRAWHLCLAPHAVARYGVS